jgi:hypothetical protein
MLERHQGWWTYYEDDDDRSYYFAPENRTDGPYRTQREVRAIIDIADDGTLAGVELIDDMPVAPKRTVG